MVVAIYLGSGGRLAGLGLAGLVWSGLVWREVFVLVWQPIGLIIFVEKSGRLKDECDTPK